VTLGEGSGHNTIDMSPPPIEGFFAFRQELMALVYGGNPRDRPGLVVQDLVRHMRRHSKPGHSGYASPAQIM
jgi:hypothetical protein